MKAALFGLMLALAGVPLAAGEWSLIGSAHWIEKTGEDELERALGLSEADFDIDASAGAGGGFLWESGRWGVELKAAFSRSEIRVRTRLSDAVFILELDTIDLIPVTAVVQYRFGSRDSLAPYLGAGAAWLHLGEVEVPGSDARVEFDDDFGFVVNAGVDVSLSERWVLNLDGKHVPFETATEATSPFGETGEVRIEPLIWSAGLRFRF